MGGCMSILTLRQAPPGRLVPGLLGTPSPASVPRLPMALAFAGSAGFAVAMAMVTTYQAHRMWGVFAGCSYLLAAMAVLGWKSRGLDLALVVSLAGALVAPMWLMAGHRLQQRDADLAQGRIDVGRRQPAPPAQRGEDLGQPVGESLEHASQAIRCGPPPGIL